MNQSQLLASTTSPPPSSTLKPEAGIGIGHLLWIPYVTLTLILMALACASFIHYHFKNREKYIEAMFKRKNNLHNCPKKYRVTLNRKGLVGCVDSGKHKQSLAPEKPVPNSVNHDIFIVSKTTSKKNDAANFKSSKSTESGKLKSNQSYDNEAYDQDSSQGSEKSLIRKSTDSHSQMDTFIELEHDQFNTRDTIKARERGDAYMVRCDSNMSAGSYESSGAPRSAGQSRSPGQSETTLDGRFRTGTPTGLVFRSETPLNIPDNSDYAPKKIVLFQAGSRSTIGLKHATVAPLREETDDEIFENGDDTFPEEDVNIR